MAIVTTKIEELPMAVVTTKIEELSRYVAVLR
jgi:hypothetical protein